MGPERRWYASLRDGLQVLLAFAVRGVASRLPWLG